MLIVFKIPATSKHMRRVQHDAHGYSLVLDTYMPGNMKHMIFMQREAPDCPCDNCNLVPPSFLELLTETYAIASLKIGVIYDNIAISGILDSSFRYTIFLLFNSLLQTCDDDIYSEQEREVIYKTSDIYESMMNARIPRRQTNYTPLVLFKALKVGYFLCLFSRSHFNGLIGCSIVY
jgi:hypothetical protein